MGSSLGNLSVTICHPKAVIVNWYFNSDMHGGVFAVTRAIRDALAARQVISNLVLFWV